MVLAGIAVAKGQPPLRLPRAALVAPPNAAALLVHDVNNVNGTFNRLKVDDGVVAKTKFVDVIDV